MQTKSLRLKPLILALSISRFAGSFTFYFIRDSLSIYLSYPRPWYSPSVFIYIIVTDILCIFMGLSAYLVISSKVPDISVSMYYYTSVMALNFTWSILFFRLSTLKISLFIIFLLIFDILITLLRFYIIDPIGGLFLLPILAWTIYMAVINGQIITLMQIAAV